MDISHFFSNVLLKIFFPFTFGFPTGRRTVFFRSLMGLPTPLSGDRKSVQVVPNIDNSSDDETNYNSWLKKHPCGLESFEGIMKGLKRKKIVVFLDYDGTLSPIVDDPDRAFMSSEMREAVREVAKCFPTAIISGRSRDKVKEFVKLSNVHYAGSHGMDITTAPTSDNEVDAVSFQPAKKFLPVIQQDLDKLEKKVETVLERYPDFHITSGKKVMEIRPTINWNKGHAMEYYLHTLGHTNEDDVVPLYIGDDRTDEDAFKVIQMRGQGIAILVSSIPKNTRASYSLKDPSQVLAFLLRLVRWRKLSSSSITNPLP